MSTVQPVILQAEQFIAQAKKGDDLPAALKLKLHKLHTAEVAEELITKHDGINVILKLMRLSKDQNVSLLMDVLIILLSHIAGLESLSHHRQTAFEELVEHLHGNASSVVCKSLKLLCILTEYFPDSYHMVDQAMNVSSSQHNQLMYSAVVTHFLDEQQETSRQQGALLLSLLFDKAVATHQGDVLVGHLQAVDFTQAIQKAQSFLTETEQEETKLLDNLAQQFSDVSSGKTHNHA